MNKTNKDGSVNSYADTKILGHGWTIPFTTVNFESQIEKNIQLAVILLNIKGYETITSCHGHSKFNKFFNNALRSNGGPQITVKVPKSNLQYFLDHFNTFFVATQINKTIDNSGTDKDIISICIRSFISNFFTNKFLCNRITVLCNKLPYEYIN